MYLFTFGQTLTSAVSLMYQIMQSHWLNAVIAIVYFTLPTAAMMWVCTDQRGLVERLLLTAAAYAPALVAAIAWDLSRFLVATSLCGLIAILMVFTIEKEPASIRPIYSLVWVVGILNLAVPLVYVQNTIGYVIDEGVFPSPLRSKADAAILYYSRNKPLP
jgi:chromate transport protein ChrA